MYICIVRERHMGRPKKYFTEEERKAAKRESNKRWDEKNPEKIKEYKRRWKEKNPDYGKQWYQDNKEKCHEQKRQYRQDNKEEIAEWNKQYYQTPIGRAYSLLNSYRQSDKAYGRGECTLTAQWIIDNIFTKPCAHCGKTGWDVIGCNRLDNSLPHTMDNVEPCCLECNVKLPGRSKRN